MTRVRFEIDEVMIHRPRKRWRLYFIVLIEDPKDSEKMILTILPQQPFRLSPQQENSYQFDTDQDGSEGLFVFSREMPKNREINVHVYLRHTRSRLRNLGDILKDLESGLGEQALGILTEIVGTSGIPWLSITKKGVPLVGQILSRLPDRDFGFLSAFERFGPEFEQQTDIDRVKDFTGDASLVYSWSVELSEPER
jgi:hypothetical protein